MSMMARLRQLLAVAPRNVPHSRASSPPPPPDKRVRPPLSRSLVRAAALLAALIVVLLSSSAALVAPALRYSSTALAASASRAPPRTVRAAAAAPYRCDARAPNEHNEDRLRADVDRHAASLARFVRRARKFHITYGDARFAAVRDRHVAEARASRLFDSVVAYTPADLSREFRATFGELLRWRRGGGFWVWKIEILKMTFARMRDGDFVVYMDAGTSVANHSAAAPRLDYYLRLLNASGLGMLGFRSQHLERIWTTDAMFRTLGVHDNEAFYESGQYLANIMLFQKNGRSQRFLRVAEQIVRADPFLLSNRDERDTTRPEFRKPRHDQSLFSVLRKCMGVVSMHASCIWNRKLFDQEPLHGTHFRE